MLFQLKKLPEIIHLTRFLKSFWILYIDQIIVYNAFYSKLTFYIIKDRCQMHTLKVFHSPVWLLLHKLSSPHYRYIRKMRRGDRLPLTQLCLWLVLYNSQWTFNFIGFKIVCMIISQDRECQWLIMPIYSMWPKVLPHVKKIPI